MELGWLVEFFFFFENIVTLNVLFSSSQMVAKPANAPMYFLIKTQFEWNYIMGVEASYDLGPVHIGSL